MPVDRSLAEDLARTLVDLYEDAQTRLAADIARRLAADIEAPDWVTRKLAAITSLRRFAETLIRRLDGAMGDQVAQALILAHIRGGAAGLDEMVRAQSTHPEWLRLAELSDPSPRLREMIDRRQAGLAAELARIRSELPGAEALQRLVFSLTSTLRGTHLRILRWSLDVYREVIARAALPDVLLGLVTRRRAAQVAWEQLLGRGITGFVDRRGRRWELASYTEMATRTGVAQAAVEGHLDRLGAAGLDLVIVSNAPQECSLCLVPGTVVEGPVPTWRTRLEYTGDVISIVTASGKHLTGTPDHAVLTPLGWRRLKDLHPGDQVISHDGQQGYPGVVPDDVQVPTLIEKAGEAFAPFLLAGPTRRDLDSDRAYREVRAVWPDGNLLAERHPALAQPLRDLLLVGAVGAGTPFLGADDPASVLSGEGYASGCVVCRVEQGSTLLRSGLAPSALHSLGAFGSQDLWIHGSQAALQAMAARSGGHAGSAQVVRDRPTADVEGGAELLRALSGHVAADKIVSLGWRQFRGHVWDLSTEPAWFIANGIVTHNCRPWESKVLVRSGPGGRRTVTTEHAIEDGRTVEIDVRGSVDEAIAAGLMHPNCRHSLSAYLPGVTHAPTHTQDPQGDADRQKLRALERDVRKAKLQAQAAIDPAARKGFEAKVRAKQAEIRSHVEATGLIRQRQREQIGTAR